MTKKHTSWVLGGHRRRGVCPAGDDGGYWPVIKEDEPCPYSGCQVQRAANFREEVNLWEPGRAKSPIDLMIAVIREKCKNSDWHPKCEEKNDH